MLNEQLKNWLNTNASQMLYDSDDLEDDALPEGWEEKQIKHYGGEDMGSEYWTIYNFTHKDGTSILVRINGWYQSYAGAEYDSWEEVVPVEKTVIEYEAKK